MAQEPDLPPPDAGFEVVRRGYDQRQVDAHLQRLDAEIQILATDREAALDQSAQLARELDDARARAERLRVQVRGLASPPQSVHGMSERMRSMLRLAEDEAGEMLNRAEREAEQHRREADDYAVQVLSAAQQEAAALRAATQDEAAALRAATQAEAERSAQDIAGRRAGLEAELTAHREQLAADRAAVAAQLATERERAERDRTAAWTASETRRREIEEDFTIAMDRRRSEALALLVTERDRLVHEIETRRGAAAAQARAHLEQARRSAEAILADAHRRRDELIRIRGLVVDQLGGARRTLDESLAALEPLPEERPGPPDEPAATAVAAGPEPTTELPPAPAPSISPGPAPSADASPARPAPARRPGPRPEPPRPTPAGRSQRSLPGRVAAAQPVAEHG